MVSCDGLTFKFLAAFDLTMVATAYMLLHEVRHVRFNVDGGRPLEPEEEFACDAFAREFLLQGVNDYVATSGELVDAVVAKRQAGIALGGYAVYELTPKGGRGGTENYPPIADRLDALLLEVGLPTSHWFWVFVASLLIAIVVDRDPTATVPDLAGEELCHALVHTLRETHEM